MTASPILKSILGMHCNSWNLLKNRLVFLLHYILQSTFIYMLCYSSYALQVKKLSFHPLIRCGQIGFNLVSNVFMENQPGVHNTFATACVPIFGMNSVRICNNKSTKSRCNKYHILITGSGYPQSTTKYSQTSV